MACDNTLLILSVICLSGASGMSWKRKPTHTRLTQKASSNLNILVGWSGAVDKILIMDHYVRLREFLCACSKRREKRVERTLRRQQLYLSKFIVCSVFLLDVIILEVGYGIRVVHSPAQRRQYNRMWNQTSTGRNGGYMTDLHERPFRRSKVLTRDEIVL